LIVGSENLYNKITKAIEAKNNIIRSLFELIITQFVFDEKYLPMV
jgi:hypothetical protein